MSRKLFSLIACLVLVLGFGVVPGSAQEEEGGEFVIRPTRINPPDGSVDIYVPLGDSIIIRTGWAACTRGLAQAWTKQNKISLWVNGESMFSSPDEARLFWSDPESYPFPSESSCVNDQESGWAVYWEYPLGELAEGTYTIHYEENVDHPFLDGGDYDGDGKPDIDEWHISVDFNIIVTEMGSISGIVTEEGTGEPIEGMVVDVCDYDAGWDGPCFSAWTEADGSYFIPGIPVGTYRVFSGWDDSNWVVEYYNEQELWALATPVEVEANTELSGVNFTLVLGGSISGTVTEQESGAPLANAWVEACDYENGWPSCFYGETDVDGNYFIPSVPDGSYRVAAYLDWNWVEEFYSEQAYRDFADFVVVEVDTETSGINFTLEKGGAISGTVTDQETSTPLAGAWVEACDYENGWPFCFYAETEADGSYSIPHLPVGTYRVNAYLEGNWVEEFYSEQINWDFADAVNVVADVNTPNIDFTLEMGGSISGLVTDGDGNPLAYIGVDVKDGGYGTCTDENGNYTIAGLPFGTYDIVAGRDFCEPHPYAGQVMPGITIDEDNPNVDGINFELAVGGSISGTVVDEDTNLPVVGVDVVACYFDNFDICWWDNTAEDGKYQITGLPEGEFRVHIWSQQGYIEEFYNNVPLYELATPVPVTTGVDTPDINFTLELGGSISGLAVLEGTQDPIGGIDIEACYFDNFDICWFDTTEEDGSYLINVPEGVYRVHFYIQQGYLEEFYNNVTNYDLAAPVSVSTQVDTPNINFTLELGGTITGTVKDGDENAIAGIWVEAYQEFIDAWSWAQTDEDGTYQILGLPGGDYRVYINTQDGWIGQDYQGNPVTVIPGSDTFGIDFTLVEGGTISGTVYEANSGDPLTTIAGVHVDACSTDDTFCNGTETNEFGEYTITGLPADKEYRVFIWGQPSWASEVYQETIWWEEATIVSPDAIGIDFTLDPGGSISGLVTDGDGNPLANIGVDIMDGGYGNCTDENGYYSIMGLPFGTYDIVAGRDFCGPHPYVEDVKYGITINGVTPDVDGYNFELTIGGSISGTVTTVDGEGNTVPVIGLWVDACHESVSLDKWGNSPLCNGAETNQGGFYTITHLLPGNYRIVTWGTEELSLQFYDGVLNYYEASLVTVEPGQIRDEVDFSLFVSGPAFNAWPIEDYIDGWGWDEEVPVTLTIDNPSNGIGTDYTITLSPFPDTTLVMFELQGVFDLDPGYIVTLDNGIHTKQHTVTKLAIAGTDLATSSVFGTAEPGSHVYVWYYTDEGRIDRHEVAGASGSWTANFSMPGDEPGEEQTYMIPAGAGGEANQVDFDGDGTQVNWWMQEP